MKQKGTSTDRNITGIIGAILFLAAVILLVVMLDLPKLVANANDRIASNGLNAETSFPPNLFKPDVSFAHNDGTSEPTNTPEHFATPHPTESVQAEAIEVHYSIIDIGHEHIIAVKNDGTVYASGNNANGRCDVSAWDNIVEVAAGYTFSIGLREDGSVLFAGNDSYNRVSANRITSWKGIKHIAAHGSGVIAINEQGKVLVDGGSSETGREYSIPESVEKRTDAVAVSAGNQHLMVLFSDRTVAAFGDSSDGMCDVESWRNIVAISAGAGGSVGLTASGDVLYSGIDNHNQNNYVELHNVTAISTKGWHLLYLQKDGIVGAVGWDANARCDTAEWNESGREIIAMGTSAWNSVVVYGDGTVSLIGHKNLINQTAVSKWKNVTKRVVE